MTEKTILEKHWENVSYSKAPGYIDPNLVNQEASYYMQSKPNLYGYRLIYQYVTMKDGTIYELLSNTGSYRGLLPRNCKAENLLQRDIKEMAKNAIRY